MEGRGLPTAPPKSLRQGSRNTGPKGVRHDYAEAKKNMIINRTFDAMRTDRMILQNSHAMRNFYLNEKDTSTAVSGANSEERIREKEKERYNRRRRHTKEDYEDSDEYNSDSDDERQFEKFKEEKIREMQASLPTFGNYAKAETFDDLAYFIKANHDLSYLVVHVYENTNRTSLSMHLTFENLAPQFPYVAFVRIRASIAMPNYESEGLPTLLIYKGTKLYKSVIAVGMLIGPLPSDHQVAQLLAGEGVLTIPTGGIDKLDFSMNRKVWDEGYESDDNDVDLAYV